jgi:ferritin
LDEALNTFSHWVLQEQREEVASMSDLLSMVERASESNILLAEDYLARPRPASGR